MTDKRRDSDERNSSQRDGKRNPNPSDQIYIDQSSKELEMHAGTGVPLAAHDLRSFASSRRPGRVPPIEHQNLPTSRFGFLGRL